MRVSRTSLRARRRFLLVVAAFGILALAPFRAGASDPVDPNATAIRDGLRSFTDVLAGVQDLDALGRQVPYTNVAPTGQDGLRIAEATRTALQERLAGRGFSSVQQLSDFLDDPDEANGTADDGNVGGAIVDIASTATEVTPGTVYDFAVTVSIARDRTVPLALPTPQVDVSGGATTLGLDFTTTLPFRLDTNLPAAEAFHLRTATPPAMQVAIDLGLDATTTPFTVPLGLSDVTVRGTLDGAAALVATIADPDQNQRLTAEEWTTTAAADLFDVAWGASNLTADLTLGASLPSLAGVTATISIDDNDLGADAGAADDPQVQLGPLVDLKSMSAADFLSGIAQVASSLQAMQIAGPAGLELPFIEQDLAEVVKFNERLGDFFVTAGLSQAADPFTITADAAAITQYDTLQEIAPALSAVLGVPVAFDLDPATHQLTWNLRATESPGAIDLAVDIADELGAIGLTAVDDAAASARVTPAFAFDIGIGVDLDPARATSTSLLDKVWFDTAGTELTADFPVEADLNLTARVGFLGLELTDADTAPGGRVDLVRRKVPADPMLRLDLTAPGDKLTVQQLFERLEQPNFGGIVGSRALNAEVPPTNLTAAAKSGTQTLASATFGLAWPDVTTGAPQLSNTGAFETSFLDFDFDRSNPAALFTSIMDAAEGFAQQLDALTASSPLLSRQLPFVGRSFDTMANRFGDVRQAVQDVLGSQPETMQHLEAALETRLSEVLGIPAASASSLLTLHIVEPPTGSTAPTAIEMRLHYGLCHQAGAGCNDVEPLHIPFNLGDGGGTGGVVGMTGNGNITVDYKAIADLNVGVELPQVTAAGTSGGVPTATGTLRPYLVDSSKAGLSATVTTPGELQVGIGAAHLYLGKPGDLAQAKLGVDLTLENDQGDPADQRVYFDSLGSWFSGLVPADISPSPKLTCAGVTGSHDACGRLPVYLSPSASSPLGVLTFTATELEDPATWQLDGLGTILDGLVGQGFDWQLIVQGLQQLSGMLDEALQGASYGAELPVIGGALDAGAGILQKFNAIVADASQLAMDLSSKANAGAVEGHIRDFLRARLEPSGGPDILLGDVTVTSTCDDAAGGAPAVDCADGRPATDLNDVQVRFTMGQISAETAPAFDLGFPGLRLGVQDDPGTTADNLRPSVSWAVDLAFGISVEDGFYLVTNNPTSSPAGLPELRVDFGLDLPDTMHGDIAFIPVAITDNTPTTNDLTLNLRGDLGGGGSDSRLSLSEMMGSFDPARDLAVSVAGDVAVKLHLVTGFLANDVAASGGSVTTPSLPVFKADFELLWHFGAGAGGESLNAGLATDDLTIDFKNVKVDLGSVLGSFLKPILAEVDRIIRPIKPVIEILTSPIPGVKEIAELVGREAPTLLSIMETQNPGSAIEVIRRVAEVIRFIGVINAAGQNDGFDLGSFSIDKDLARNSTLAPSEKGALVQGGGTVPKPLESLANGMKEEVARGKDSGGFSLPAFENPQLLFQLLVGKDVDIVKWDAGHLEAKAVLPLKFGPPIGICPCSAGISISFGIRGHLELGYDTRGIREAAKAVIEGNPDALTTVASLFQGIFVGDLRGEVDVPEVTLFGSVAVQAALDVGIAEAGIRAGISAEIDLNLHDGGRPVDQSKVDGKLYIDEIAKFLNNPICLFDASGSFSVFVELYADTFLTPEVTHTLFGPEKIVEFPDLTSFCDKKPDLAHVEDGRLVLHMGPLAAIRNIDVGEIHEQLTVRQLSPTTFSVSGFGFQEEERNVTHGVFAEGDLGNDTVTFLAGGVAGTDAGGNTTQNATAPVVFCGGGGNDRVTGGAGTDTLVGDGGRDGATWTCTTGVEAGGGNDVLNGAGGDDTIVGQGGADNLTGGDGVDTIDAGLGNDQVLGAGGNDVIRGGPDTGSGADNDTIFGGVGNDTIDGGIGADIIDGLGGGSVGSGDSDVDTIRGGEGDDRLAGGPHVDTIDGQAGNDTVNGGPGNDIVSGGDGHDDLFGDEGSDTIHGGDGHDDLVGGSDDSVADVAGSGDRISGGEGVDYVLGDGGVIVRTPGTIDGTITPDGTHAGRDHIRVDAGADVVEGGAGGDDIAGGDGADLLRGGPDGDLVHGDAGSDRIFGDSGADSLHGDDDADVIRGGHDGDEIWGNGTADELHGDSGADTIRGNLGDDVIRGGIGDDCIEGNEGLDTVHGDADADRITGGSPAGGSDDLGDRLFGGGGNDVIAGDNATVCGGPVVLHDVPFAGSAVDPATFGTDTIEGGEGDDILYGQSADERILGGAGLDYIEGNAGSDTIFGGPDADDLVGGSGYDFGGTAGARRSLAGVVDENVAGVGDTLEGEGGADHLAGDNALLIRATDGSGGRTIELHDVDFAGDLAVVSASVSGNDVLRGGPGADVMYGQGAADKLFGGGGDDYGEGNNGLDEIDGDEGDDDLVGGSGRDNGNGGFREFHNALDEADILRGGDGHDVLLGDNANVSRPGGTNAFNGSVKRDVVLYDVERVSGPAVSPDVHGDETQMTGDDGDDLIFGQGGDDLIEGAAGDDDGEGNSGTDVLRGGPGQDNLVGGSSANDGVIDADRDGSGLLDESDTISGELDESDGTAEGSGGDVIMGDNARVVRLVGDDGKWLVSSFNGTFVRAVEPADVELVGGPPVSPLVHGDERLFGNDNDDVVYGQGGRDLVRGGAGDDLVQGNHDVDTLFGGPGQDDISGGTFAANRLDAGDFVYGDSNDDGATGAGDGHDVLAGDNARIDRPLTGGRWTDIVYGNGTQRRIEREVTLYDTAGPGEASGSDVVRGGGGDDDIVGQFDDGATSLLVNVGCYGLGTFTQVQGDLLCGDEGEDAMIGDLGTVENRSEDGGTRQRDIAPKQPFIEDVIFEKGSLTRIVTLQQPALGGHDVVLGGPDADALHGGAGADVMNGNAGDDALFGDDGDDAAWGGVGHDHLYGGHGADSLDVQPRVDDPPAWSVAAPLGDTYEDIDHIYGGWGADAMQANIGRPGPHPGDRLIDWVGGYNAYYVCPGAYGERVITRAQAPGLLEYLNDQALGDGARNPATAGSSGYGEVAIVQKGEAGQNSNPPHADHPAHFTCT